jgi:hypothetical protein
MKLLWGLPISCLLATASAFFPLHLPNPAYEEAPANLPVRRHVQGGLSARFPLLRRLAKRQNNFNIIKSVDPKAPNSLGVDQDGTDFSYFIPVEFGTSKKVLYLLLDTAAVNTWIMSSDCKNDACAAHTTYGPADSTTLKVGCQPEPMRLGSTAKLFYRQPTQASPSAMAQAASLAMP